jgi:DNA-binding SARP family transcriptional activator/TolB-like protein/Flp pilus assembly protein TadD
MFHLRLLGAIQLTTLDGKPVEWLVRRPRRTALLAYLAAAKPRGLHRRDKLLALFWPESDELHARAALNQALYVLRTELGDDAIAARGNEEVGLNYDGLWCDVIAFEDALDAGRPADALSVYRGDLLDGFHVSDLPEFERWLERERERLRHRAADGTWVVAETLASQGDVVEAERWARRVSDLLPADETVARRLMTFLRDVGDRAAAVRAYEKFATSLKTEFELEPSAETSALANAIRREDQPTPEVHLTTPTARAVRPLLGSHRAGFFARHRLLAAAAALGVLLALGAGGFWFTSANGHSRTQPRLAVLPFENLGAMEDQYFANGMTEELNGRLTRMTELLVSSRTSAAQYARSGKTLRQIGADLGVEYILEGTIRTDRVASAGTGVRVGVRLVRIADEGVAWSDQYTASMIPGEIFRVQADIAERVADALGITLREREHRLIAAHPTNDPYAYDYYLRGRYYDLEGVDENASRLAQEMYERAIAADTGFALAYARLARIHGEAYWFYFDRSSSRLALAKETAERAVGLKPDLPEAHLALGYYHYWGRLAYEDAIAEFRQAQRLGLTGAEIFLAIANVQRRQGKFDEALSNLESAVVREPQTPTYPFELAMSYGIQGSTAKAAHYFDRAIKLNPRTTRAYWNKARLYLGINTQTANARAALEMPGVDTGDSVIQFHLAWVDALEGKYEQALTRLRSSTAPALEYQWRFVPKAQLSAAIYTRLGRMDLARAYYDSARIIASHRLLTQPDVANFHSALAIAYAGLGRKREAIDEAQQGVRLLPITVDAWRGLYRLEDQARVYAMLGEYDAAFDELDRIFKLPGVRSMPIMELGAPWGQLRDQPRFQSLLARTP